MLLQHQAHVVDISPWSGLPTYIGLPEAKGTSITLEAVQQKKRYKRCTCLVASSKKLEQKILPNSFFSEAM